MNENKYLKYIPTYCAKTVHEIDYNKLYELGKRIILTDLDNTLISYNFECADDALTTLNNNLQHLGFKVYIVSNNNEKRINKFKESFAINGYLVKARKPNAVKINEFIKKNNMIREEIIFMGDQLVTDIAAANNAGLDSILVSTIDPRSQKWYTKINRLRENVIISKIAKFDLQTANMIKETVKRGSSNE